MHLSGIHQKNSCGDSKWWDNKCILKRFADRLVVMGGGKEVKDGSKGFGISNPKDSQRVDLTGARTLSSGVCSLISCLACKKLRSHNPILTSKKPNELKKQEFFLDLPENRGHRANCCPQN